MVSVKPMQTFSQRGELPTWCQDWLGCAQQCKWQASLCCLLAHDWYQRALLIFVLPTFSTMQNRAGALCLFVKWVSGWVSEWMNEWWIEWKADYIPAPLFHIYWWHNSWTCDGSAGMIVVGIVRPDALGCLLWGHGYSSESEHSHWQTGPFLLPSAGDNVWKSFLFERSGEMSI